MFLTESERRIAVQRTLKNKTGSVEVTEKFQWSQVAAAAKDPQAWCLVVYTFCVNLANGGLTSVRKSRADASVVIFSNIKIVFRHHYYRLWLLAIQVSIAADACWTFPASFPHHHRHHLHIHPIITHYGHDAECDGCRYRYCFDLYP